MRVAKGGKRPDAGEAFQLQHATIADAHEAEAICDRFNQAAGRSTLKPRQKQQHEFDEERKRRRQLELERQRELGRDLGWELSAAMSATSRAAGTASSRTARKHRHVLIEGLSREPQAFDRGQIR